MKLFMIFHIVCLSVVQAKVHSGGSSFAESDRSENSLQWIATANECLMKPSKQKLKCINCAYSYNFAILNPYSMNLEQDKACIPGARDNRTDEWRVNPSQVGSDTCGSAAERYCEATVYFVNKAVVAVSRGCSGIGSCRASMRKCVNSGYGIAKSVCKSCCNEDGCNYWGDEQFYGGSIMTPETMCSKSMSEVQNAMNLPIEDNEEGKCNNN